MQKSYTGSSTAFPALRELRHSRMPCMSRASALQPAPPQATAAPGPLALNCLLRNPSIPWRVFPFHRLLLAEENKGCD